MCRSAAPNVTVLIAPGTYPLTQPLILTEADSFTTWKAAGRAKPVHSGGRVLNGTWSAPAKPGAPWTMALPAQTPRFNQLFVSGERATRAREPEWGSYFQMEAELPAPHTGKGFVYRGHDLTPLVGQGGADGAELVVYNSWQASRRNIAAVNASSRSVLLTAGAAIAIEPYANSGSRYYAENFAAACDSPGEWYHDLAASTLLWQPRHAAEDPHSLEFVAPIVAGDLLLLDGKPSRGHLGCILPRVPAT